MPDRRAEQQSPSNTESPFRFGLRALFVATAIVAVLAAGAGADGWFGLFFAFVVLCIPLYFWAGAHRPVLRTLSFLSILLGIIVVLLRPINSPRFEGRGDYCAYKLRDIGRALLAYDRRYGNLPPLFTTDPLGRPLTNWRTHILPYVEESHLHANYRFTEFWDAAHNSALAQTRIRTFHCPSDPGTDSPTDFNTSYVAIVSPGGAWIPGRGLKLSEIKDNLADTILLVEMRNSGIAWAEPRDLDISNLPPGITPQNFLDSISNHPGIVNVAFADGSIMAIPATIPWSDFLAMLTIAGGETIDRSKW